MTASTFAGPAEVIAHLEAALEAAQRLPVTGADDLNLVVDPIVRVALAVRHFPVVEPQLAVGTRRYRERHGLAPIERNANA
jgi:hypothetical protein